jgi:tetratricopeptide (TPR) repeat protein
VGRVVGCLCISILLTAAVVAAGDLTVPADIRLNTPQGRFIEQASNAAIAGDYAGSAGSYQAAMDAISGSSREDRLDLAVAKNGLGVAYARMGRYAEGEPLVGEALALWREILGPRHVNVAVALNNVADLYGARGRYEDARRCQVEALKIDEAAYGESSPLVANDFNNVGVSLVNQRKFSAGEQALRRAIDIAGLSTTPHPRLSDYLANLAAALALTHRFEEAEDLLERALSMQIAARGRNHPSVGRTMLRMAECAVYLKRYGTAVRRAEEAVGILRSHLGEKHPDTGAAYFTLATAYAKNKRLDLAEPALQTVLEIDRAATVEPGDRSAHLREYAWLLRSKGKKSEAKALEVSAAEIEKDDPSQTVARNTVDVKELGAR